MMVFFVLLTEFAVVHVSILLSGDIYLNETSFCEAQNFHLIEGKKNCFNYDPTVFGSTTLPHLNVAMMCGVIMVVICMRNILN
jgi:hypothetical protein